jgi:hypothetical protein
MVMGSSFSSSVIMLSEFFAFRLSILGYVAANARIKSNQGFVKGNENNPKALWRFYAPKEKKIVYRVLGKCPAKL